MKQKAIIWKKSVYQNGFVCPKCGTKLFNISTNNFLFNNVRFTDKACTDVICYKCGNPVAHIKVIESDLSPGLHGKYDSKKYGDIFKK